MRLLSIRPLCGEGNGRLFRLHSNLVESELVAVLREVSKMEGVAFDLLRYICRATPRYNAANGGLGS